MCMCLGRGICLYNLFLQQTLLLKQIPSQRLLLYVINFIASTHHLLQKKGNVYRPTFPCKEFLFVKEKASDEKKMPQDYSKKIGSFHHSNPQAIHMSLGELRTCCALPFLWQGDALSGLEWIWSPTCNQNLSVKAQKLVKMASWSNSFWWFFPKKGRV